MKKCPFCAEEIQEAAIKCRFCKSVLTDSVAPPQASPPVAFPSVVSPPAINSKRVHPTSKSRDELYKKELYKTIFTLSGLLLLLAFVLRDRWWPALGRASSNASVSVASGPVFQDDEEAAAVAFLEGWKNRGPAGVTALFDPRAPENAAAIAWVIEDKRLKSYERLQSASEDSVVLKQTGERIKLKIFKTVAVVRMGDEFRDMRLTIYIATDTKRVFIVVPWL